MSPIRLAASLAALLVLGSGVRAADCHALDARFKDATERYDAAYKRQTAAAMCSDAFLAAGDEVELIARERLQIRQAQDECPPVEGPTTIDLNNLFKSLSTGWKQMANACRSGDRAAPK